MLKNGKIFDSVERAVSFNKCNKSLDEMPSIAQKIILSKKIDKTLADFDSKTGCSSNKGISFCGASWTTKND